ncbi:MAG: hypothetical protein HY052_04175 [Proteobacteria bacterium]|nr:hypothetical protein [Pseudomonadota bacterium]
MAGVPSHAQNPPTAPPPVVSPAPGTTNTVDAAIMKAKFTDSLFFSTIEITLIQQALIGKPPNTETLEAPVPAPGRIEVSGILYRAPGDWIVWVNGHAVTPKSLIPEIVDIKVESSSKVSFRWYDANQKAIIPVTMRPRQVYDIATGRLLMVGL